MSARVIDETGVDPSAIAGTRPVLVDLRELRIDERYQREAIRPHIEAIRANYNEPQFQPLLVARRPDGVMFVIDGRQRRQAALALGKTHAYATVIDADGSGRDEATFFNDANTNSKAVNRSQRHAADVFAGNEPAVEIEMTLQAFGISALPSAETRIRLNAVGTMYTVMNEYGGAPAVEWVVGCVVGWLSEGHRPSDVLPGKVVGGLGLLYRPYSETVSASEISDVLSVFKDPAMIIGQIENVGHGASHRNYSERIRSMVNKQSGRPLMPDLDDD